MKNVHDLQSKLERDVFSMNFSEVYKTISVDSNLSVEKCWWNEIEYDCHTIFVNHPVDNKMCFTFNQDSNYMDFGQLILGNKINITMNNN